MKVIHKSPVDKFGFSRRSTRVIDPSCAPLRCGGGWRGTRARIRRDLEKRAGRDRGHDVRRYDVPLADQALANQVSSGRIRGSDSVRRMPWVSGILPATARGAVTRQVRRAGRTIEDATKGLATGTQTRELWLCASVVRRADLRAARAARSIFPSVSSAAELSARAGV